MAAVYMMTLSVMVSLFCTSLSMPQESSQTLGKSSAVVIPDATSHQRIREKRQADSIEILLALVESLMQIVQSLSTKINFNFVFGQDISLVIILCLSI